MDYNKEDIEEDLDERGLETTEVSINRNYIKIQFFQTDIQESEIVSFTDEFFEEGVIGLSVENKAIDDDQMGTEVDFRLL